MSAVVAAPCREAVAVANPVRRRAWLAGGALALLLAVNLPAFARKALDCDPLVFDLFARDMGRGRVLYRDMLENNTPAMIAVQAAVRSVLGPSPEALRVVDVLVVGAAVGLLGCWFHAGRPDRRLLATVVLAAAYLSTSEWCHCQRDVWCLLPVTLALYLRRAQLVRPAGWRAVLEGVVWGLAVWLKPHTLLVAAAVWLAGRPAGRRVWADLLGLLAGGLLTGAVGVGAMWAVGVWEPYVQHLTTWAGEYPGADMYSPRSRWECLLSVALRNSPWSLMALAAVPAGLAAAVGRSASPERRLLGAALAAWFAQGVFLQHVFDYIHAPVMLLGVAYCLELAAARPAWLGLVAVLAAIGHGQVFAVRAAAWADCWRPSTPALRDDLARGGRLRWVRLQEVTDFLTAQGCRDGEVSVLSDTALPVYTLTGLTPPTRYYTTQNAMLAYQSRLPEILTALAAVPGQRFAVVDVESFGGPVPADQDWKARDDWPLPAWWYGPRRWADRVAFRAGKYVVLAVPAAEVPPLLVDLARHDPNDRVADPGATSP